MSAFAEAERAVIWDDCYNGRRHMPLGPGKYDDLCTEARQKAQAQGAILIILDGAHGSGFSCQADLVTTAKLPELLERLAADIRQSYGYDDETRRGT